MVGEMVIPQTPIFHYSSYWGMYSRILMMTNNGTLEFSINPIQGLWAWYDIKSIKLRYHGTPRLSRHTNDFLCPLGDLPKHIVSEMEAHLGASQMSLMLTGDIWALIDWTKFLKIQFDDEHIGRGGVPIKDVLKGR